MPQTLTQLPANLAVVDTLLRRMVGDAYGAMATIPLYCVGKFDASQADSMVMERYDVWHSYLVVAREMLRSTSLLESPHAPLDALFEAVDHLRDAFLELLHARTMKPVAARIEYERLVRSYQQIPRSVEEMGELLDLTPPLVPEPTSLKWSAFDRSLQWFGKELNKVAGTLLIANTRDEPAAIE